MAGIAIIDDDPTTRAYLENALRRAFEARMFPVETAAFSDGDAFLAAAETRQSFDAVFVDIEMPGLDGIEVCRRLNRLSPDTCIVFVSNREELVFDAFEVTPFRFIPKARLEDMLPEVVRALVARLRSRPARTLTLSDASGQIFSIPLNDVVYVEARNKTSRIVGKSGETLLRCGFSEVESHLPTECFIKIHRSYIVNASCIFLIGKQSVSLTNREELPMSRNRSAEVRAAFLQYARRQS